MKNIKFYIKTKLKTMEKLTGTNENDKIIKMFNEIDSDYQKTNEQIAEFLNWTIQKDPTERFFGHYFTPERIKKDRLHFDSDWDWLMPVIFKILDLKNIHAEEKQKVFNSINPNINKTYFTVIEFIKWYNKEIS